MSEPREIIASCLWRTKNDGKAVTSNDYTDQILATLDAAGFAIVPKVPTPEMKDAGRILNSQIGMEMAEACYRAMLTAAGAKT